MRVRNPCSPLICSFARIASCSLFLDLVKIRHWEAYQHISRMCRNKTELTFCSYMCNRGAWPCILTGAGPIGKTLVWFRVSTWGFAPTRDTGSSLVLAIFFFQLVIESQCIPIAKEQSTKMSSFLQRSQHE